MPKTQRSVTAEIATHNAMLGLVQRLSLGPERQTTRIVAFIAARPGEGTSTLAREYAIALASQSNQHVLLLNAIRANNAQNGIVDAAIAGHPLNRDVQRINNNTSFAYLLGNATNSADANKVIHNPSFWKDLLTFYDALVIDAPSLHSTFDGIAVSLKADAVIIVVEAEKTPQPVIEHLRNTLTRQGAKIAGIVMNKRRYYIPGKIYEKL